MQQEILIKIRKGEKLEMLADGIGKFQIGRVSNRDGSYLAIAIRVQDDPIKAK